MPLNDVLLTVVAYSQRHGSRLAEEFWQLTGALETMSRRAQAANIQHYGSVDVFSKLAGRLKTLHARTELDPNFRVDLKASPIRLAVESDMPRERHFLSQEAVIEMLEQSRQDVNIGTLNTSKAPSGGRSRDLSVTSAPVQPTDGRPHFYNSDVHNQIATNLDSPQDQHSSDKAFDHDLFTISQSLIDPDFTGLDRILNFDDMLLGGTCGPLNGWNNVGG